MSELEFAGQRDDEEVILVFRRHMIAMRKEMLFLVVMVGVGFLPILIWPDNQQMFWVWLGFIAVGLLGFLYAHILWHCSVYIVTDQRIRQVSQRGLFRKTVVDLGLDKIQSISYNIPGIKGGMFDYGTILIQTQVGDMSISLVPKPEKIYNQLQDLMGKVENYD